MFAVAETAIMEKITKEDINSEVEKVYVEVLSTQTPRDTHKYAVGDDVIKNYKNLTLNITDKVNNMVESEWDNFEALSQNTLKWVRLNNDMMKDYLRLENPEDRHEVKVLSHTDIQTQLRKLSGKNRKNT
jgi:hypothetical protein